MELVYWLTFILVVTHSSGCGDGDEDAECAPEAAHSVLQKRAQRGVSSDVAASDGSYEWDRVGNDLVGKNFKPKYCPPGKKCQCDGTIYFFHNDYYGPNYYMKRKKDGDYHQQYWGPKHGFRQKPESELKKIGSTWGDVWCDSRHFELSRWRNNDWYNTWGASKWGAKCQCWPKLCAEENQACEGCKDGTVYFGDGSLWNHKGPRGDWNHGKKCSTSDCWVQPKPWRLKIYTSRPLINAWWREHYHHGTVQCANGHFFYENGKDPKPGHPKRCWCVKEPTPAPTPVPPPPPTPAPTPAPTWPLSLRYCPCVETKQQRYRVVPAIGRGSGTCPYGHRVGSYVWGKRIPMGWASPCKQWRKTGKCSSRTAEEHCQKHRFYCSNKMYFFENGTRVCPGQHTITCATPKGRCN